MKILVDENLSRSLIQSLKDEGHNAESVRDCRIRGFPDDKIFDFAQDNREVILTRDRGIGNIWRFPLGQYNGIIIVRLPNEMPVEVVNSIVIAKLRTLSPSDIEGNAVIIEKTKIRIRKP